MEILLIRKTHPREMIELQWYEEAWNGQSFRREKKKMAALSEILEPRFVERFVVEENNSYEDLVEEIKNQFPGLKREG